MPVIGDRKAAAYVEDFDLMDTCVRLSQYRCRNIKSLNEVLEVGALAAHVKAQSLDLQSDIEGSADQIHCFSRVTAEFGRQLHH